MRCTSIVDYNTMTHVKSFFNFFAAVQPACGQDGRPVVNPFRIRTSKNTTANSLE
jgi:hypothetical protein